MEQLHGLYWSPTVQVLQEQPLLVVFFIDDLILNTDKALNFPTCEEILHPVEFG